MNQPVYGGAERERIEASRAMRVAIAVAEMLSPFMERFEFVGSLRRECAFVGDAELLLEPRIGDLVVADGLFERHVRGSLELDAVNRLVDSGVFQDRIGKDGKIARGERYQRISYDGVKVDLFVCIPPAQWGLQMFLRTGPREWTQPIITQRCQGGSILPEGMYLRDGCLWKNARHTVPLKDKGQTYVMGELVETPTERSFFEAIGLAWTEPCDRLAPASAWRKK